MVLTDALIADRRFNCYIIMKNFLFTLYQWPPNHLSNIDNFQLVHQFIWKILFLLDERYETMIELINYFIYVGDYHQQTSLLTQAKSLLHDLYEESERRYRKGSRKEILKSFRMLEIIYRIYMEYLDLIEWKNNGQISASASAIRVDKLKTNFTDLMDHFADDPIPELNLDIIPLTILELSIDHLNDTDEAFETLLKYSKTFPDNLNGHVFLYEFMKKFNHLNVDSNVPIDCLRNIERLCPDSKY
ncbi:hypothetical protein BLA29_003983, partial [Euroglyphus maynei]